MSPKLPVVITPQIRKDIAASLTNQCHPSRLYQKMDRDQTALLISLDITVNNPLTLHIILFLLNLKNFPKLS